MKTIFLIEDSWTGHRPTYLKHFNRTLLEMGHRVVTCCPNPEEIDSCINDNPIHINKNRYKTFEFKKDTSTNVPLKKLTSVISAFKLWKSSNEVVKHAEKDIGWTPDIVFMCVLDGYLESGITPYLIDKVFHYPWSGLYFHPKHLRMNVNYWDALANSLQPHAGLASANCKNFALLDKGVSDKLAKMLGGKEIVYFPDIINDAAPDLNLPLVKLITKKAQGRKVVALLGSQSRRKGVLTLMKVAKEMENEPFLFIFAGNFYQNTFYKKDCSDLLSAFGTQEKNCFLFWNVVPDGKEFNSLVSISDILFLAYEEFPHSSNMLNKASYFKKPIVVSKKYLMGEYAERFRLGVSINEGNVTEAIAAIRYLNNNTLDNPLHNEFCAEHDVKKLTSTFKKILNV